jgi:DNA polymerase-3 subunit alpha
VMNTKDRVPFYVAACDEQGIEVEPPDVNVSAEDFRVVDGKIRFGLNAVKNVGESAVRSILAAREEGGPFASIWDFCERVDPQQMNKRALESLVKSGALDSTGATRMGMLEVLEDALVSGGRLIADRLAGQGSIFDLGSEAQEGDRRAHHRPIPSDEFEKRELLALEKESLGLYVSEHPLDAVRDQLRRKTDCRMADVERRRDGEVVTVGGIVSALKQLTTKKGEPMVFLRLDDLSGSLETVVFNSVYAAARELLEADRMLVVKGRVDHKDEVRLHLDARRAPAGTIRELAEVVKRFPGEAEVLLELETSGGPQVYAFGPGFRVRPEPDFHAEVKALLGEAAIS